MILIENRDNSLKQLIFVIEKHCVLFEALTEYYYYFILYIRISYVANFKYILNAVRNQERITFW
jgi:hypothetical protein